MDMFFYKKRDGKIKRPSFFEGKDYFYHAKNVKNLTEAIMKMKSDTGDITDIDFRLSKTISNNDYKTIDFDVLKDTDFSGCLFENCIFENKIENCKFQQSVIKKCKGVFFTFDSDFYQSILKNNSFYSVNIFQTSFHDAIIDNNSFYHSSFEKMSLSKNSNIAISDYNVKSFQNNECEDGYEISNETLFKDKHKTFLEKYKYKLSLLGFSILTIPLPSVLHHYDVVSSLSQHILNYSGYTMLGISSLKEKIKNAPNENLENFEFYFLNMLDKLKNKIYKKTGKEYDSCIVSQSENTQVKKIINDITENFSSVKIDDLDVIFLSPDTYCTIINILMKKNDIKDYNEKTVVLINDNCKEGEISSFVKNPNGMFIIEKGNPDKVHNLIENDSKYKYYLNKAIQDFSKNYSQNVQKEFFEKYNTEFPFNKENHILLKSENTYYVLNMDTLENTNENNLASIICRKDEVIISYDGIHKKKLNLEDFKRNIDLIFQNDIIPENAKFI